jgi:hypothetical protein
MNSMHHSPVTSGFGGMGDRFDLIIPPELSLLLYGPLKQHMIDNFDLNEFLNY